MMRSRENDESFPRVAAILLGLLLPREYRAQVLGDVAESFKRDVDKGGRAFALKRLWREVLSLQHIRLHWEARGLQRRRRCKIGSPLVGATAVTTNLRCAARSLSRAPIFTLVSVLTLGVGIAAATTIFSVVDGVILRPLPYRSPQQLVFVWDRLDWVGIPRAWVAAPQVADLRTETTLFEGFAALKHGIVELTGDGDPEQLDAGFTSANLFDILGVRAVAGRLLAPGDDEPGAQRVAVLSHGLWCRRFGGETRVLGTTVTLDGQATTIVGVLPVDFNFLIHSSLGPPTGADLWLPYQEDLATGSRGDHSLAVLGRVRDGISLDQARAELAAVGKRQDEAYFGGNGFTFSAVPVHGDLVARAKPTLMILFGAVGLVLIIASANVASLLIARAQQRDRETAIRRALGASGKRIVWEALVESCVIAILAAGVGLAVTTIGLDTALAIAPDALPRKQEIEVNARAFLFAGLTTLVAIVICGVTRGGFDTRVDIGRSLREGGNRVRGGRRASARNVIVIAEVALSTVLLLGSGLLLRSFVKIQRSDPGFSGDSVLAFDLRMSRSRYPDAAAQQTFVAELLERLAALPGVESVGAASAVPLSAGASQTNVRPDALGESEDIMVDYMTATPGYLKAVGIDVVSGRGFTWDDVEDAPAVAVVDESLAALWPGGEAVGREIHFGGGSCTVVGVVRHARLYRLYADDRPQVYLTHAQVRSGPMSFVLRTTVPPLGLAEAVRRTVGDTDPNQPVADLRTMQQVVRASVADQRFAMVVMLGFGLSSLMLAILGVYGVLSYAVNRRVPEIGVRMALGAKRTSVIKQVIFEGLALTLLGVMAGVAAALAMNRLLAGVVHGISTMDPATFLVVPLLLTLVGASVCYVPASRASRVDPMTALRLE